MDEVRGGKMFWRQLNSRFGYGANSEPGQLQRFKPALLFACREQQGGKGKREEWGAVRPHPPNQDVGWSQWRDGSAVSFLQAANAALVRLA